MSKIVSEYNLPYSRKPHSVPRAVCAVESGRYVRSRSGVAAVVFKTMVEDRRQVVGVEDRQRIAGTSERERGQLGP